MRKVIVDEFMTLDGVVQGPGYVEGIRDRCLLSGRGAYESCPSAALVLERALRQRRIVSRGARGTVSSPVRRSKARRRTV